MADSDNISIARRLYEDWNKRDFDHLAGLLATDGEIVLVGSGTSFRGPDGARQFAEMWATAFPDGEVAIERAAASGDQVTVEYTGRGTHTGALRSPGGDIPATGRSVTLQLCDVFTIESGRVKSMRSYFDSMSLLTQIGVMPTAGVASAT
jgi:steroid delta-isomerase-like uncharacterized protein